MLFVLCGRVLQRPRSKSRSVDSACAESSYLATRRALKGLKSAPVATSDTLEGSLNYTKTKRAPQLLLVLLLLLLLVRWSLHRLWCCSHPQEVPTPRATHLRVLHLHTLKGWRIFLLLLLPILLWMMTRSSWSWRISLLNLPC